MKASLRFLLALSLASGALLSGCGGDDDNTPAQQDASPRVDLRLMETTDIHANVMDYNYYSDSVDNGHGLVRTAMLVKQAREEIAHPENSALVDNGDLIQVVNHLSNPRLPDLTEGRTYALHFSPDAALLFEGAA